jgi:regulator of RNase E activity RraA
MKTKFKIVQYIICDNDGLVSISPAEIKEITAEEDDEEEDE